MVALSVPNRRCRLSPQTLLPPGRGVILMRTRSPDHGSSGRQRTASLDYDLRVEQEIETYQRELIDNSADGLVAAPAVWSIVEGLLARRIEAVTGCAGGVAVVAHELDQRDAPMFLSLGAGTCALEVNAIIPATKRPTTCTLECLDFNPETIAVGRGAAAERGVDFVGTVMDVNRLRLEENRYDVVLAWAALHHFVELDHIAREINKGLKPDGVFITMDICSRNGFVLWPENERVVDAFWQRLPKSHRYARTLGAEPQYCDRYPNVDCSLTGFECIRSEDVLPSLRRHLDEVHFVPAHALARRFFDTMFGGNFDLGRPFDLQFFLEVMIADELAIARQELRPDTFFAVYRKRVAAG